MTEALRVGLAGLGTVGGGVVKLLSEHRALLEARAGRLITLVGVAALEMPAALKPLLKSVPWYDDARKLAASPDIDVMVELIGGADGIAKQIAETALGAGKALVCANKALIAKHGIALATLAEQKGVALQFEAAVAGGIPILKLMREGLVGNKFSRVYGILNGTCNYILTGMEESGRDFSEVLAEAQKLGYAEADPAADVDGHDAANKLAILTSLAFGTPVSLSSIYVEGIRSVSALDIDFAAQLGYRIKLLAIARMTDHGLEQRVHPCMVDRGKPVAQVMGVLNAVVAEGDFVGQTVFEGPGAGERATASAVVSDLVDVARGHTAPPFSVPVAKLAPLPVASMDRHVGAYYVRLVVRDQPGVLAEVARIFAAEQVSIESVLQRGRAPEQNVPLILTTHECVEAAMMRVRDHLAKLPAVVGKPAFIRIEEL
ncbi:MAG: homoserine dehydrogenase [Alphaproteobacteria bacterium]|nr:homoserine dehydrogenase [Alphaproteobacteria bacterium]